MDNVQERALGVQQCSMGATRLPLELQQHVYSFLDTKTFQVARNVCRWWRYASLDSITLGKQLKELPILPPADVRKSSPLELQKLWSEAAYKLMLGTRVQRQPDSPGSISAQLGFLASPKITAVNNGNRTVTINDRMIALFETADGQPKVVVQRPLNDLKETVGGGPWLSVTPTSYHELALSSDGKLLAIAQERMIQIYDLSGPTDSFTVNAYISSAAGHYICGLDFEQSDHVLRVRLSGKGTVLYLGTPPAAGSGSGAATIEHWKSKAGLKHTFLDSSLLAPDAPATFTEHAARVSGLQLLRPLQDGWLFAAQKHSGSESSHYVLGHVKCSLGDNAPAPTAEPEGVTMLARLESFLSAWDYTLTGKNESGMGLWENMPSSYEHHPTYALSPDGSMLVVAERDKKAIRPLPLTQLFLYRVPNERRLLKIMQEEQRKKGRRWATLASFLDNLEQGSRESPSEFLNPEPKTIVARIPLCLGTIRGVVNELKFERAEEPKNKKAVELSILTAEATMSWMLTEV